MSDKHPIRISDVVTADDRRELEDRLNAFNVESTGFRDARALSCLLRDQEGTLVADIDTLGYHPVGATEESRPCAPVTH